VEVGEIQQLICLVAKVHNPVGAVAQRLLICNISLYQHQARWHFLLWLVLVEDVDINLEVTLNN
jgi:hypothetical protein